jgi:hypothetical protein
MKLTLICDLNFVEVCIILEKYKSILIITWTLSHLFTWIYSGRGGAWVYQKFWEQPKV